MIKEIITIFQIYTQICKIKGYNNMTNSNLKELLRQYESKRNKAISEADLRKKDLYSKNPRLQEIDQELTSFAFSISKALIKSNDKSLLDELNKKRTELNNEKEKIYKELNITPEFFQPHYECKKCNDTGFITENYETTMCTCLKQKLFDLEYNKSNMFDIKTQTFENFNSLVYSNEPNKEKYNANISPRENIEIIKKLCINFINDFDNPNSKNLLFTGNTGLGKTFLSNCIANELLKKQKTVMYQTAPIMLDSIIEAKLGKNKNSSIDLINNLLSVDLLIIDDLGTEGVNNMKFSELFTILNSRLLNNKNKATKTIISTNLSIRNLADVYGERIVSRLIGNYNICYFFGEDLRLKR